MSRYGAALVILVLASMWGPHRNWRVGEMLDVRRWRLWDAWLNYVGLTVLRDAGGGGWRHQHPTPLSLDDPRTSSFKIIVEMQEALKKSQGGILKGRDVDHLMLSHLHFISTSAFRRTKCGSMG